MNELILNKNEDKYKLRMNIINAISIILIAVLSSIRILSSNLTSNQLLLLGIILITILTTTFLLNTKLMNYRRFEGDFFGTPYVLTALLINFIYSIYILYIPYIVSLFLAMVITTINFIISNTIYTHLLAYNYKPTWNNPPSDDNEAIENILIIIDEANFLTSEDVNTLKQLIRINTYELHPIVFNKYLPMYYKAIVEASDDKEMTDTIITLIDEDMNN